VQKRKPEKGRNPRV